VKVTLTKLISNHNTLRTDVVDGECERLPVVGESWVMYSAPLEEFGNLRYIRTSPVVELTPDGFRTENSTYALTVHPQQTTEAVTPDWQKLADDAIEKMGQSR
jgi:hypothetical protein